MTTAHLRRLAPALALGLLLALAACGRQAPIDTRYVVTGTAAAFDDALPLAIAYGMIDAAVLEDAMKITASGFVEAEDGLFLGPLAPVAEDGSFELVFPDPSDVPEATLAPADGFLAPFTINPECTLSASDAQARVSALLFFEITLPGLVGFTLEGAALAITTDTPLDWEAETEEELFGDATIVTWVYADRAVDVGATEACADEGLIVDLSLRSGWNQVGFSLDFDEQVVTLANDDAAEVVVQVLTGAF